MLLLLLVSMRREEEHGSLSLALRQQRTRTHPSALRPPSFATSSSSSLQGKFHLGYKQALKSLRAGKSQLLIIAANTPPLRKSELEYYAMLAKTTVHHFKGTNGELGTACGRLYRVAVMSVVDPGDSDILRTLAE